MQKTAPWKIMAAISVLSAAGVIGCVWYCFQSSAAAARIGRFRGVVSPLEQKYGHEFYVQSPTRALGSAWLSGSFTHTKQFEAARLTIERQQPGWLKSRESIVEDYRDAAMSDPKNPLALFKWGYSAMLEAKREYAVGQPYWVSGDHLAQLGVLTWLMADSRDPHDYQFTRLRYCLESAVLPRIDLQPIADRLLAIDPDDATVLRTVAYQLSMTGKPADARRAMGLVDRLLGRQRSDPYLYVLKGRLYHEEGDQVDAAQWDEKAREKLPADSRMGRMLRSESGRLHARIPHHPVDGG